MVVGAAAKTWGCEARDLEGVAEPKLEEAREGDLIAEEINLSFNFDNLSWLTTGELVGVVTATAGMLVSAGSASTLISENRLAKISTKIDFSTTAS